VDGILNSTAFQTTTFTSANTGLNCAADCAPTAGLSLAYYWSHCAPQLIPSLYHSDYITTFKDMYRAMGTNAGGTGVAQAYQGLINFAAMKTSPIKSSGYDTTPTLSEFETNIKANHPMLIAISGDPAYAYGHAMFAVGYNVDSTQSKIRVATGFSPSWSNFYAWSGYIKAMYFVGG